MKVYEWVDHRGNGVVTDWSLQQQQRAKLDQKLHLLVGAEVNPTTRQADLPPQLLVGPNFHGEPFVYKMKVHGNVQLRPMLCLGPLDEDSWTILCAATERDRRLLPLDAAKIAEARRQTILSDATRRRLLVDDNED